MIFCPQPWSMKPAAFDATLLKCHYVYGHLIGLYSGKSVLVIVTSEDPGPLGKAMLSSTTGGHQRACMMLLPMHKMAVGS